MQKTTGRALLNESHLPSLRSIEFISLPRFGGDPEAQILSNTKDAQKRLKCNNQYVKSVHFKKTVARISFLSKLWYFQYKSKQKIPQF